MDLSLAGDDVLFAIFHHLDPLDIWRARLVSAQWCEASENAFARLCKEKGWRLPRRPRGADETTRFPHRRLYRTNACMRCVDGPGEFRISRDLGRQLVRQFSLCRRCVSHPDAVSKLQEWNLRVDFQSVTGQMLPGVRLKRGSKRERASGEAIDRGIRGFA